MKKYKNNSRKITKRGLRDEKTIEKRNYSCPDGAVG